MYRKNIKKYVVRREVFDQFEDLQSGIDIFFIL